MNKNGISKKARALPDKERIEALEAIHATWQQVAPEAFTGHTYATKLSKRITKARAQIAKDIASRVNDNLQGCAFNGAEGESITCPKCLSDSPFHSLEGSAS